jgi:hypothetical protein
MDILPRMKMTPELKDEIDSFTFGKIKSLFRFFPSDYTTGESGRYLRDLARQMNEHQKKQPGSP